jgi:methionyl-tRNA synthetase
MKSQERRYNSSEVIDKYDGIIRKSFSDFGISFDNYSRTSAKIHHDTFWIFTTLYKESFIEQVTN